MEARAVEEREAQRQRIEELVGFVSTLGAAMGRTMPASLVLPLPQAATPVSTNILLIMFQPDIGHTRKNMQSQTYNMVLVVTAVVVVVWWWQLWCSGGGGVGGGVLICMFLTVIVPFVFLQGLETSPCRGGSAEIFY